MSFNINLCAIPQIWCGDKPMPKKKDGATYIRKGTSYECLKKGFGAGKSSELKKSLPEDSLQNIKYIGDTHEKKFKQLKINNIDKLVKFSKDNSKEALTALLSKALKKSNEQIDKKAYNSVLMFLYKKDIKNLPSCKKLSYLD
jgi:NAD-specific glutamate dehydrogenase